MLNGGVMDSERIIKNMERVLSVIYGNRYQAEVNVKIRRKDENLEVDQYNRSTHDAESVYSYSA